MKDAAYYRAYRLRKKQGVQTQRNGNAVASPTGATAMTMKAWSAYDGANWSTNRGWIYFPNLDSTRDLDDYTLLQLRQKSRWLYNNVGLATRIIDGLAKMVGALTPVPLTDDKEWNQLALKKFMNDAGAEFIFDASGKFNFWSAQPMLTGNRLLDGDILGVLSETQSGIAQCMFYEAHQIGNANVTFLAQDQWQNGVYVGPANRALQYRIIGPDGKRSVDISASDAMFHCQYRRPCRQRGEPVMRHAINNLLDRSEILGFIKAGTKNANSIGYQIVRTQMFSGPGSLPALGTGPVATDIGNGTQVAVEQAYTPGKVPVMNPGEEIKLLLDQRPHSNQLEFMDYLVRDIAWGVDIAPDLLWNIAKVGGADVRYLLADAQKTIEKMQDLLADQFCSRFWVYYLAKELKAGRLPACKDPEWWKHGWQPEQKLTVDIGRDGELYLQLHKSGMISLERFFSGAYGVQWRPEMDKYLDERKYIIDGITARGMTYDQAFPPSPGTQSIHEQEALKVSPQQEIPQTGTDTSQAPAPQAKAAPLPQAQAIHFNVGTKNPGKRKYVITRPDGSKLSGEIEEAIE